MNNSDQTVLKLAILIVFCNGYSTHVIQTVRNVNHLSLWTIAGTMPVKFRWMLHLSKLPNSTYFLRNGNFSFVAENEITY